MYRRPLAGRADPTLGLASGSAATYLQDGSRRRSPIGQHCLLDDEGEAGQDGDRRRHRAKHFDDRIRIWSSMLSRSTRSPAVSRTKLERQSLRARRPPRWSMPPRARSDRSSGRSFERSSPNCASKLRSCALSWGANDDAQVSCYSSLLAHRPDRHRALPNRMPIGPAVVVAPRRPLPNARSARRAYPASAGVKIVVNVIGVQGTDPCTFISCS